MKRSFALSILVLLVLTQSGIVAKQSAQRHRRPAVV